MNDDSGPALQLTGVTRAFLQGGETLTVLRGADLAIDPGEVVGLVGQSGAGKSTLLHIAGLLERPDEGEVTISGLASGRMSDTQRTELRRRELGFVYQFHHLMPEFSAQENIVIPQMINGISAREARSRALDLLAMLRLNERATHRPAQLSGGEQQRVAILRAVANAPRLLLADEPTGNLDQNTANAVFDQLLRLVRETGLATLIATHNLDLAERMDRVVVLSDGVLTEA